MPGTRTSNAPELAQRWHDSRSASRRGQPPELAACTLCSCWCCCCDCDPDYEHPEPNPYFDDAMAAIASHGRIGTYSNGCRCEPCEQANRDRAAKQPSTRRRVRADPRPRAVPHGVAGYDIHGCRCDVCRAAYAQLFAVAQQQTLSSAVHHGAPWTGDDLAVAQDRSLTALQAALTLGRTLAAVKSVRASRYR